MRRRWRPGVWNWGNTTFESRQWNSERMDPRYFWVLLWKTPSFSDQRVYILLSFWLLLSYSCPFYLSHTLPFQEPEFSHLSPLTIRYIPVSVSDIGTEQYPVHVLDSPLHFWRFLFLMMRFLSVRFDQLGSTLRSLPHPLTNLNFVFVCIKFQDIQWIVFASALIILGSALGFLMCFILTLLPRFWLSVDGSVFGLILITLLTLYFTLLHRLIALAFSVFFFANSLRRKIFEICHTLRVLLRFRSCNAPLVSFSLFTHAFF
jgi:hypothetical protein